MVFPMIHRYKFANMYIFYKINMLQNHYQKALNVDGLSRLPVKYEDRIIEKYRDIIVLFY
jgi:hypothetical protein